jgi:predicted DCC family thiol-disulfide oxidoreductase YuxK
MTPADVIISLMSPALNQAAILYDADCGFCKWSVDKILGWDRRRVLRPVPIQSEEGARLLAGVPRRKWLASWHLALPSGEVRSAGAAAAPLAELLPGGKPLAFLFRSFPRITDRCYAYVAAHPDRFGRLLGVDATCLLRR